MNIDEAIKILTAYSKQFHPNTDFDYAQAVKLGIEALGAWRRLKQGHKFTTSSMLPGETKD